MTRPADEIVVRRARRSDAMALGRVYVETWRSAYAGLLPDRVLLDMSRRGQARAWAGAAAGRRGEFVLVAEDPAAGVVGLGSAGGTRSDLPFGGEVYTLYVAPDHQGCGVGRRLLSALYRGLIARGVHSVLIWVLADNPSRFFYEAMGGRCVAEREEMLWGARMRELAYGWPDLHLVTAPGGPCSLR